MASHAIGRIELSGKPRLVKAEAEMDNNFQGFGHFRQSATPDDSTEGKKEDRSERTWSAPSYSFGFGQFGQVPATPVPVATNSEETASISSGFDMFVGSPQVEKAPTPTSTGTVDSDSFLAEPSIDVSQFDRTVFAFFQEPAQSIQEEPEETGIKDCKPPSETASETKSSCESIPTLVEETLPTPVYLEEPATHSLEDARIANAVESWEVVEPEQETVVGEDVRSDESGQSEGARCEMVDKVHSIRQEAAAAKVTKPPVSRPARKPRDAPKPVASDTEVRHSTRTRKTVDRLATDDSLQSRPASDSHAAATVVPNGTGARLGDIEAASKFLQGNLASHKTVILLHRVLFDRMGEARVRKTHIRQFCGTDGGETKSLETKLLRHTVAELRSLAQMLGVSASSDKTSLTTRLAVFLSNPTREASAARSSSVAKKTVRKSAPSTKPAARKSAPSAKLAVKRKQEKSHSPEKRSKLTPELVDSDVDSETEREVMSQIHDEA